MLGGESAGWADLIKRYVLMVPKREGNMAVALLHHIRALGSMPFRPQGSSWVQDVRKDSMADYFRQRTWCSCSKTKLSKGAIVETIIARACTKKAVSRVLTSPCHSNDKPRDFFQNKNATVAPTSGSSWRVTVPKLRENSDSRL